MWYEKMYGAPLTVEGEWAEKKASIVSLVLLHTYM